MKLRFLAKYPEFWWVIHEVEGHRISWHLSADELLDVVIWDESGNQVYRLVRCNVMWVDTHDPPKVQSPHAGGSE